MSAVAATRIAAMLGERVDLLSIDTSTPRPWLRGAHRIVRPSGKIIWFSPRGVGKSLAAMILAVQVVEEGGCVTYLDLENGARRQAERLAAILSDRDAKLATAVAERFDYRPRARLAALGQPEMRQAWAESFAGCDLLVIDSTARALGQLGLDENAAVDFSRFMVEVVDPIAEQGAAVLQLDNVGHDQADRTRGSSTKLDLAELAYKLTADPIAPDRHGTIRLERVRTRDGDEASTLEVEAGGGSYGRVQPALPGERQRQLDEELIEHITEHPGDSTTEIAKAVGRRTADTRSRLVALEDAGTTCRTRSQGRDRTGRRHTRTGWYLAQQSQLQVVPDSGTDQDHQDAQPAGGPESPPLKAGPGTRTTPAEHNGHVSNADIDRAEAILAEHQEHTG